MKKIINTILLTALTVVGNAMAFDHTRLTIYDKSCLEDQELVTYSSTSSHDEIHYGKYTMTYNFKCSSGSVYEYKRVQSLGNNKDENETFLIDSKSGTNVKGARSVWGPEIIEEIKKRVSFMGDDIEYWNDFTDGDVWYGSGKNYSYSDFRFEYFYDIFGDPMLPAFPFDSESGDDRSSQSFSRVFLRVTYIPDPKYKANVILFPGLGDDDYFNNLIIVGDAFDPNSSRDADKLLTDPQYRQLIDTEYGNSPRNKGYDLMFVDFGQGGGNIVINAMIELALTEWVEKQTSSKYIVGGPSMSGIVGRLALLLGNKNKITKNAKGYISIDSPHQGASISTSLQKLIGRMSFSCYVPDNLGPKNNWYDLHTPASFQMMYSMARKPGGTKGTCSTADMLDKMVTSEVAHDNFYNYLEELGDYRFDIPNVAIAYSDLRKPHGSSYYDSYEVVSVFEWSAQAGGPIGTANWHEFMPGSTGSWYYSSWKGKKGNGLFELANPDGEVFKGTFIPVYSALDVSVAGKNPYEAISLFDNDPWELLMNNDPEEVARHSPFDKVMWMDKGPMKNKDGVEADRFEHIVFDEQLMDKIYEGLLYIENKPKVNIVPTIITPLLLN